MIPSRGPWVYTLWLYGTIYHYWFFMPPPLGAGGIMFSGCPSVCPSVRSLKYPLLTCTWVRWSTRPTVTVLRLVRPWVLYRQLELTKLTRPDLHHVVCLLILKDVRLSVCPSVTPLWLCSHHRIIMKFSGVITSDRSDVHAKGQDHGSKVKVTEVTTQLNHFRTVTPVWIHIWWWNDAYSLIMLRRGALSFLKVILQISRSHG